MPVYKNLLLPIYCLPIYCLSKKTKLVYSGEIFNDGKASF